LLLQTLHAYQARQGYPQLYQVMMVATMTGAVEQEQKMYYWTL